MKPLLILLSFLAIALFSTVTTKPEPGAGTETAAERSPHKVEAQRVIDGRVRKGETLTTIFKKYGLDLAELFQIGEASASVYRLADVHPDHRYRIAVDRDNNVRAFTYWIDSDSKIHAYRNEEGFEAEKKRIEYDKKTARIGVSIKDNLISSLGTDRETQALAFDLSDIFAWDLDFTSDIRKDDIFKVVAEEYDLNGQLKKYGDILCAEYIGANGKSYRAYRFDSGGKTGYYDEKGRPFKKAFLKVPLSFRRVSSGFSLSRLNPVLKVYRPHYGIDYAAPTGTPVSAVGDGTVTFVGRKGGYGNLIVVRHANGYRTYYGHLSRIAKKVRPRVKVAQGQTIGYVGSTGISTGPHLHYEIRVHRKPVNPATAKMPKAVPLSGRKMARFKEVKKKLDRELDAISTPLVEAQGRVKSVVSRS